MYKYFAWKDDQGNWRGQKLLSSPQISSLLHELNGQCEVFATIQDYDEFGNIVSCPIYIDLDGEINQALAETRYIVYLFQESFNLTPKIYFSGRKGFHIILPYEIKHPQCHYVVRNFVNTIDASIKLIDQRVYRPRAMFRLRNSPASRKEHFKVEITANELMTKDSSWFDSVSRGTRTVCEPLCGTEHLLENDLFKAMLLRATANIPQYKKLEDLEASANDLEVDFVPCLKKMFETPPAEGQRNHTIFVLAKFFKSCALSEQEALHLLLDQPHYQDLEGNREVSKVLRSVYQSTHAPLLGCKEGFDAKLMRQFCSSICHYRDGFPKVRFAP